MRTAINTVAADVHEMNHSLDELRAQAKASEEPASPSVAGSVTPSPNGSGAPEVGEREKPGGLAAVHPPSVAPPAALPPIPDLRPQLEAFMNTVIRNQQATISLLRDALLLVDSQTRELSDLKQQMRGQQNVMSNMRRF